MYDYNEFAEALVKELEKAFPEKEFILRDMEKNNVTKHAMVVKSPDDNIAPTIYLDTAYKAYQDIGMEETVARMTDTIDAAERGKGELDVSIINDPEYCKEHLICHLVRGDNNEKYLSDKPHQKTPFGELVMYINIERGSDHSAGIPVTNDAFENMLSMAFPGENGMEEAFRYALDNTVRLYPPKVKPMFQVIREIMAKQFGVDPEREKEMKELDQLEEMDETMYVLSNEDGVCGAVALAYPNNLERISVELFDGKDMVVLPSSVHEVILVKPRPNCGPKELLNMVREVNENEVPPDEVLADDAFYYKADTKEVVRATDMIKDMEKKKEKSKTEPER